MPQNSTNTGKVINNAKIGCLLTCLVVTGIASLFHPGFLFLFAPFAFVFVMMVVLTLILKSSKTARALNYTSTLANNYRKYGPGDWHTTQAVSMMIRNHYQNEKQVVNDIQVMNDWGNHYTGSIVLNGTSHDLSATADGSGNVTWDLLN